jgi:hypothetical protein
MNAMKPIDVIPQNTANVDQPDQWGNKELKGYKEPKDQLDHKESVVIFLSLLSIYMKVNALSAFMKLVLEAVLEKKR